MIKVTILRTNNDDDEGNLPSRFFPGAGSGHGWFQLEQAEDRLPTHSELSWGLRNWNDDCVLMDYDVSTGTGRLVMVDWYAPAPGTVIELELNRGLDDMVGAGMDADNDREMFD
ncbi:hypothetical protein DA83_17805 [Pseudomonas sp. 250J]|uniref:hypothetical protein n=1 Tax=Pseudomonas sp. 250J TaxID=1478142 RepID=UPI0006996C8F|nr:hypothetical protein [Pseudomonas sp. 250J]KNX79210.1 hypothetical protein DA83_17805 [Pseudomonas sp. 250J]